MAYRQLPDSLTLKLRYENRLKIVHPQPQSHRPRDGSVTPEKYLVGREKCVFIQSAEWY